MAELSSNRGGRPPLAAESRRAHTVSVRFTGSEIDALRRRAARAGRSIAAVIREDLARADEGAHPTRAAAAEDVARRVELRRVGRLLNDAVRALHSARGNPGAGTLDALGRAGDAVARQLARWS